MIIFSVYVVRNKMLCSFYVSKTALCIFELSRTLNTLKVDCCNAPVALEYNCMFVSQSNPEALLSLVLFDMVSFQPVNCIV